MTRNRFFEFPNKAPARKYYYCIEKKMGMFSGQGFQIDRFINQYKMYFNQEELKKMVNSCIPKFQRIDKTEEEYAAEIRNCFSEHWPKKKVKISS